jgi:hypothetical protein
MDIRHRRPRVMTKLALMATVLAIGACGTDPLDPTVELSRTMRSANFVYHWSPGDEAPDSIYQERHLAWLTSELGVRPTRRFEYFKYRDVEQLRRITGHTQGTGFAEEGNYRFHTIWPKDNHEYVHALILAEVGTPPALFDEGIAVAHHGASISGAFDGDPLWNGEPVRMRVRAIRDGHELPSLDALLPNLDFQKVDPNVAYPVAGSFVRHLIDETGPVPLLSLIADCPRNASAATIRARFRDAYGEEIDTAWGRWLDWL